MSDLNHLKEKTFTSYTSEQGSKYAQSRRGYQPSLYKTITDYHSSTGGQFETLLDVGCGPGIATREYGPKFTRAIGLDPSKGMLDTARSLGGENIRYEISSAEDLGKNLSPPIADASIDVITAATCAHWFDMQLFWQSADRVLKPGGTVALWTNGGPAMKTATPNSEAIQDALRDIHRKHLQPYTEPGNLMARDLYRTLPLPWTLEKPVSDFEETTFVRKEWGTIKDGESITGQIRVDMDTLEKMMGTISVVTRWREAHPEAIDTEDDVVRLMRREIERLLQEAGVEKGKEMVTSSPTGVLLLFKKRL